MKKYYYHGPLSSVTLRDELNQESNIILSPKNEVILPDNHEYIQVLENQGFLTKIEQVESSTDETKAPKNRVKKGD